MDKHNQVGLSSSASIHILLLTYTYLPARFKIHRTGFGTSLQLGGRHTLSSCALEKLNQLELGTSRRGGSDEGGRWAW
jgi:hypothetical protein